MIAIIMSSLNKIFSRHGVCEKTGDHSVVMFKNLLIYIILHFTLFQAFTMIDQNRDGLIDVSDLKEMYSSLGMKI